MSVESLKSAVSGKRSVAVEPIGRDPLTFLTFRISRLRLSLDAQAVAILKKIAGIGLGQWRVLSTVGSYGPMSSREIHQRTTLDPAFVSRTLRSLEDDKYVAVSRPDNDRRLLMVRLTASGQRVFKKTLPHMQQRQESLLSVLSAREQDVLLAAIGKLELAAQDHTTSLE